MLNRCTMGLRLADTRSTFSLPLWRTLARQTHATELAAGSVAAGAAAATTRPSICSAGARRRAT
jgi:hypothetical protein